MHLFFDLDGTLTDSAPGIVACLNHAMTELSVPCAPEARLRALIGTPLQTIFERLLGSTDERVPGAGGRLLSSPVRQRGHFREQLVPRHSRSAP